MQNGNPELNRVWSHDNHALRHSMFARSRPRARIRLAFQAGARESLGTRLYPIGYWPAGAARDEFGPPASSSLHDAYRRPSTDRQNSALHTQGWGSLTLAPIISVYFKLNPKCVENCMNATQWIWGMVRECRVTMIQKGQGKSHYSTREQHYTSQSYRS